jgi:hypothetical protein
MRPKYILYITIIMILISILYIYFHYKPLSLTNYPFNLTPKQRYDIYVKEMSNNAIISPRHFNFATSNVSQQLVNDFFLACQFALIAYKTNPLFIANACKKLGADVIKTFNNQNVYAYVANYKEVQLLCIQGTEFVPGNHNIWQVWSDININPEYTGPYTDMYVQSGFYSYLIDIWPQIEKSLDYSKNIWICAHSLGAVRGMLARSLIPQSTNVRITVFGCPKGATAEFWRYYMNINTIIEQVVAERDFAYSWFPLVPYYQPTPNFYWLTNGSIYYTDKRDWLNISFSDHSIQYSYIPQLSRLATN